MQLDAHLYYSNPNTRIGVNGVSRHKRIGRGLSIQVGTAAKSISQHRASSRPRKPSAAARGTEYQQMIAEEAAFGTIVPFGEDTLY